jgi:protein-tyrosine phosphatase
MKNTILFCCTGNYYRSRFAEIYFNHQAQQQSLNWDAFSRGLGLSSVNKGPISPFTLEALKTRAIPIPQDYGYPVQLSLEDLKRADRIIAVKRTEHFSMMTAQFPQFLDKTEFWEIHDIDVEKPASAIPKLEEKLEALFVELLKKD